MASGTKSKSESKIKKAAEVVDTELLPLSQQSSSDDGMAAVLVQKIKSGMDKKKKEKEAQYFQMYRQETENTNARGVTEFKDHCTQIDEVFDKFVLEYAKADDEIRAIWAKIVKAHAPFTALIHEKFATETQQDNEREEQHVLGLAYHRKSEEAFGRAISSLVKTDSD